MITKNDIKFVKSLQQKKYRNESNCFVVEGVKMIEELIRSDFKVKSIYATKDFSITSSSFTHTVTEITDKQLKSMSSFNTPNQVIAVAYQKEESIILENLSDKLYIMLDRIQDPGNLGTIIRIADWFGIENIICSDNSVELYNPKVIQASMGSIFRINVIYTKLSVLLDKIKKSTKLKIYGTLLDGDNIYNESLSKEGILIFGNESDGISKELISFIDKKITIPNFSSGNFQAESLNIASSVSIVCSEFKRLI